ncbi:MAG: ABC transporter ATP-binding protein/permease [Clostridia bacterium]|nr:ABC transporter ATP-binding protein/permease [Clostridia bacterium]
MNTYTLRFDLNNDMQPAEGVLSLDERGHIEAICDGVVTRTAEASAIEEASVLAGVGSGLVMAKMKEGPDLVLCRFSLTALQQAGEFCKVLNYLIQTGEAVFGEEEPAPLCEKCGRPFIEGMKVCLFCYHKLGVLKRAFGLMKPFMKELLVAESMLIFSSIFYLLVPLFNRYLIDDYLRPQVGTVGQIALLAGAMFLARGLGEVIFITSSRIFNKASFLFSNHLRDLAYAHIQKLSLNSLSKRTPGDLIRRVMEDTVTIKEFLSDYGRWAVEQMITFTIVLIILFFTNPLLTLMVVLPLPVVVITLTRFWRFIHIRYERQWRHNSRCQSILHDIIKGIRTVKSFGNEEIEIAKFSKATRKLAQVSSNNEQLWALLFPTMVFFTGVGEFLVLYFGGQAILGGEGLTLGMLVQFTMYITYIYAPLRWFVSFPRWLADATTSLLKVFEILDEEPDIAETPDAKIVPVTGGMSFQGVTFGYKSYEPVLKDISFDIAPGELVGVVGRSGAGKSTMINLLMRLYDPNMGHIAINGTDIRDISPNHLHERIGVVFQDTFLFAGSVFDNIAYAKPGATIDEVIAACKVANAHEFIIKTADGYDTLIGESGHSLSGGERQRLAIARAVIKNPDILILDEATSSLDVETESAIQESLNRITKGRTTVAIAHRLSTLRSADRLIVLDKGKIAESGTHVELLRKKGIYYNLVMAQRQTSKLAKDA